MHSSAPDANAQKETPGVDDDGKSPEPKSRTFTFHYRFRVKDLKPPDNSQDDLVRVWMPCASNSDEQDVKRIRAAAPAEVSLNVEPKFGNRILYFEKRISDGGGFEVHVPYEITRREVRSADDASVREAKLTPNQREVFLSADSLVPTSGKPLKLLEGVDLPRDPRGAARKLYDLVDGHVMYKKEGTGWGRGDTNWVCESGYGNCTDFHSLFISLARSQRLPARFEIGFSIPADVPEGPIAGYHCWAWFHDEQRGWTPVDISEADKHPQMKEYYFGNLTADRVTFSTGRDLELVPKAASPPLNYFIYPHIELGGQVVPKEKVELQFTFASKAPSDETGGSEGSVRD